MPHADAPGDMPRSPNLAAGPDSRATPSDTAAPGLDLTRLTAARVAMGRAGVSVPTAAHLAFLADHAAARDAVHLPVDVPRLLRELEEAGLPTLPLRSRAGDRREYLLRPDLGRRLDPDSAATLARAAHTMSLEHEGPPDLALVVADGLSAPAVMRQAVPFVREFLPRCRARGYRLGFGTYVSFGRVAVADEIGELCGARAVAILIGERPGLTSPDSLGVYLTYAPRVGTTDERRNCISNIRPEGLPLAAAADTLDHLLAMALTREMTGVMLKDDRPLAASGVAVTGPGLACGQGERRSDGVS